MFQSSSSNTNHESDPLAKLMEIPEFAELLQSKKMRECMELLMEGGQEALEQRMKEDREVEEMAMMLNQILSGAGK